MVSTEHDGIQAGGNQYHFRPLDVLAQAPPVINVWYTVLEANDIMLCYVRLQQHNTDVADNTIELELSLDGNVISTVCPGVEGSIYYASLDDDQDELTFNAARILAGMDVPLYASQCRVRIRLTQAPDTAESLNCWIRSYQL